jgi:uncharacterized membrane protein YbhN (UPF0104 family)
VNLGAVLKSPWLKRGAILVAVALATLALVKSGGQVLDHADELSASSLLLGMGCVLLGLFANLLTWRAILADLGSPLPLGPAIRIFFLGQIGKYVPGSVWPVLAQMELGKEHGVPRARSGAVGLLTVAVSLVAGLLVAAVTLPFTSADALSTYWFAFLAVPVLGVGLVPAIANPVLDKLFRLARRGPLERGLTGQGMVRGLFWALLSWVLFGMSVWLVVDVLSPAGDDIHGLQAAVLSIGAFSLAWTAGFLFVIAPAGAGIREAVLVIGLSPVLDRDKALLVALVSRGLMTLGDGVWALVAVGAGRRHRRLSPPVEALVPEGEVPSR